MILEVRETLVRRHSHLRRYSYHSQENVRRARERSAPGSTLLEIPLDRLNAVAFCLEHRREHRVPLRRLDLRRHTCESAQLQVVESQLVTSGVSRRQRIQRCFTRLQQTLRLGALRSARASARVAALDHAAHFRGQGGGLRKTVGHDK